MSRLDDELRAAFRRVEPSSDFAERVIRRINNPTEPKLNLWQKLKSFLEPPVARWVAVGVATSLLVAIFASQYRQLPDVKTDQDATQITAKREPEVRSEEVAPQSLPLPLPEPEKDRRQMIKVRPALVKTAASRNLLARQRKARQHRIEAEQAKEQLFMALQIASSTLNEANKMVRGDD